MKEQNPAGHPQPGNHAGHPHPGRDLSRLVERIEELPTLPQVALNIIRTVENPNSSARDIEKVLSADPALAAKILKLVNSAFFGFHQKISSLGHAIVILGFNLVKNMAVSLSVIDLLKKGATTGHPDFPVEEFWKHSVATATVARAMSRDAALEPELAFVGGLLHDVGKLVVDLYEPEQMNEVLRLCRENGVTYWEAELSSQAMTHTQVGAALLQRWSLDERLAAGVGAHHDFGEMPASAELDEGSESLAAVLAIADFVAWEQGFGMNEAAGKAPLRPQAALDKLGLTEDHLQRYRDHLAAESKAIESFLEALG